jgi:hypothetical protein
MAKVGRIDLRRMQDIKYISVSACPRFVRRTLLFDGLRGQALKEARRGCFYA